MREQIRRIGRWESTSTFLGYPLTYFGVAYVFGESRNEGLDGVSSVLPCFIMEPQRTQTRVIRTSLLSPTHCYSVQSKFLCRRKLKNVHLADIRNSLDIREEYQTVYQGTDIRRYSLYVTNLGNLKRFKRQPTGTIPNHQGKLTCYIYIPLEEGRDF